MRSSDADYEAIEDALHPQQRRTIHDLARAMGLAAREWSEHTIPRVVAKDLAVANVVEDLQSDAVVQPADVPPAADALCRHCVEDQFPPDSGPPAH